MKSNYILSGWLLRTVIEFAVILAVTAPGVASQTTAPLQQATDADCEKIKQEIQQLQDEIAKISAEMQALKNDLDQLNKDIAEEQARSSRVNANVNAGKLNEAARELVLDVLADLMRLRNQMEQNLENDAKQIQAIKDKITDLLSKLGNCAAPSTTQPTGGQSAGPGTIPPSSQPPAGQPVASPQPPAGQQGANQDCERIKQDVQQLQDEIARISAEMQALTNDLDQLNTDIAEEQARLSRVNANVNAGKLNEAARELVLDVLADLMRLRNQIEQDLENDAKQIQAIKDRIADLLSKLGNCAPQNTTQPSGENPPPAGTPAPTIPGGAGSSHVSKPLFSIEGNFAVGFKQFSGADNCQEVGGVLPGATCTSSDKSFAFGGGATVGITPYFAFSVGDTRANAVIRSVNSSASSTTLNDTLQPNFVTFMGQVRLPVNRVTFFVEGGASTWQVNETETQSAGTGGSVATTSFRLTGQNAAAGAGIQVGLLKHAGLRFEYQYLLAQKSPSVDEHNDAALFGVYVSWP